MSSVMQIDSALAQYVRVTKYQYFTQVKTTAISKGHSARIYAREPTPTNLNMEPELVF